MLLVSNMPAYAQQPSPITISTEAGFENAYRTNEWFPVRVTISNSGPDVRGQLTWQFPVEESQLFQQEIDLPQGSRKQITLYVNTNDFVRVGTIAFNANGSELARQDVRIEPLASDQLLIVVVSSDQTLLNTLNNLAPAGFSGSSVRHMNLASIPDQPHGLRGVSALFLHDLDTASLSNSQRKAIAQWVQLGGILVVSGGSNGRQAAAGVADLLPVDVSANFQQASLAQLASASPQGNDGLPNDVTVNQVSPRAGAEPLIAQSNGPALLYRQSSGNGATIFTTFDVGALRGWRGEPDVWEQVLKPKQRVSLGGIARQQSVNLLSDVLHLRALMLLPISALFGVLALYILAIGPINYLVLRRLRRLEWAWITIPLVVFGFVTGIYLAGRFLRGNDTRVSQLTIVQGFEGSPGGLFTSYNGLFSPNRARYTFGFAPESFISPLRTFDSQNEGGAVINSDNGVEVRDALIGIGEIRTVLSESTGETALNVQSNLRANGANITGEVRYTGPIALEDAAIIRGRAAQRLGRITSGSTSAVSLATSNTDFPWSFRLDERAGIDRQQVLRRLVDTSDLNQSITDANAVYLIGWRFEPTTTIQVNGGATKPDGVTLYIIRLNMA